MTGRGIGSRRLPPLLAGFGVIAFAVALMLALGWALGRWPVAADRSIMLGLRAWAGPPWLRRVAAGVTHLGDAATLTVVVLATAALLSAGRHHLTALATVVAARRTWPMLGA